MRWNAHMVFSVLSRICMIAIGLPPAQSARDRLGLIAGGIVLAGYGLFVSTQTSGVFSFSIWIFVMPVIAVGYGVLKLAEHLSDDGGRHDAARRPVARTGDRSDRAPGNSSDVRVTEDWR
jgi:hypothetical protein